MASKKPPNPRKEGRPKGLPDIPTATRLRYAQEAMASARHAADDYGGQRDRLRRLSAVRAFVSAGWTVTQALQNLRHQEPDFDAWYQPWQDELTRDPVARFFYNFRTGLLHEGQLDTTSHFRIATLNSGEVQRYAASLVPPGPFEVIMGDASEGGTTYVTGSDGKRVYFDFPGTTAWESLQGAPDDLANTPLPVLMNSYLALLQRVVVSALLHFGER